MADTILKIHDQVLKKSKKVEKISTLSECGYLICAIDVNSTTHIIDVVIPHYVHSKSEFSFLLDQPFCATSIEAMLPQGVFIGGILSKYFPGESFAFEDKDILDRIGIIFKKTLRSDRANFYHLIQVGEEFKIFFCNLSDLSIAEMKFFKILQSKTHDKSFSCLTSSLGKNFLDFNLNFELNFINRADMDSPIEIYFLQSLEEFFNRPEICFSVVHPEGKFLISAFESIPPDSLHLTSKCFINLAECSSPFVNYSELNQSNPPLFKMKRVSGECVILNLSLRSSILIAPLMLPENQDFLLQQCTSALKKVVNVLLFQIHESQCHDLPTKTALFRFPTYNFPINCIIDSNGYNKIVGSVKKLFGISTVKNIISPIKTLDNKVSLFSEMLISPHKSLNLKFDGDVAITSGKYAYYHYGCQSFHDSGWGCAYRSFQTIFSWFIFNGFTSSLTVPSIKEIQQCLVDIGDKSSSIVGSSLWIGSVEIGMVMEKILGVSYRILQILQGESISEYTRHLFMHFKHNKCPIMIGGNNLAHTILGVAFNSENGDCKFLVADPHYEGKENIKSVTTKGWVGWKAASFWKSSQSYNIILPILPEI